MKLLTMCAALSRSGGFCEGGFDASAGTSGEVRLCTRGEHRFAWDGQSWTVDGAGINDGVDPSRCRS